LWVDHVRKRTAHLEKGAGQQKKLREAENCIGNLEGGQEEIKLQNTPKPEEALHTTNKKRGGKGDPALTWKGAGRWWKRRKWGKPAREKAHLRDK